MILEIYLTIAFIAAMMILGYGAAHSPESPLLEMIIFAALAGFLWPAILFGLLFDYSRSEP